MAYSKTYLSKEILAPFWRYTLLNCLLIQNRIVFPFDELYTTCVKNINYWQIVHEFGEYSGLEQVLVGIDKKESLIARAGGSSLNRDEITIELLFANDLKRWQDFDFDDKEKMLGLIEVGIVNSLTSVFNGLLQAKFCFNKDNASPVEVLEGLLKICVKDYSVEMIVRCWHDSVYLKELTENLYQDDYKSWVQIIVKNLNASLF